MPLSATSDFLNAVRIGNADAVVRKIMENPFRVAWRDKAQHHRPVLSIAVEHENTEIVESLLAGGANPNQRDATGKSPLELAVRTGNLEIVKRIAHAGAAEVEIRERLEITIGVARHLGHEAVQAFLETFRENFN